MSDGYSLRGETDFWPFSVQWATVQTASCLPHWRLSVCNVGYQCHFRAEQHKFASVIQTRWSYTTWTNSTLHNTNNIKVQTQYDGLDNTSLLQSGASSVGHTTTQHSIAVISGGFSLSDNWRTYPGFHIRGRTLYFPSIPYAFHSSPPFSSLDPPLLLHPSLGPLTRSSPRDRQSTARTIVEPGRQTGF